MQELNADSATYSLRQERTTLQEVVVKVDTSTPDLHRKESETGKLEARTEANSQSSTSASPRLTSSRSELNSIGLDRGAHSSQFSYSQGTILHFTRSGLHRQTSHTITTNPNSLSAEMGYTITNNFIPWNAHESTIKMENGTLETTAREADGKDFDSEGETSSTSIPSVLDVHDGSTIANNDRQASNGRLPHSAFGTPSTVSTVPSCDDVSVDFLFEPPTVEKLSWKVDEVTGTNSVTSSQATASFQSLTMNAHRRSSSSDDAMSANATSIAQPYLTSQNQWTLRPTIQVPQGRHPDTWSNPGPARVASFRTDQHSIDSNGHYSHMQHTHAEAWRQQRRALEHQQQYYVNQHQIAYLPPSGQYHHTRKQATAPSSSPLRPRQNVRTLPAWQPVATLPSSGLTSSNANAPRSSAEVLKTLLRKKACLYEPDTSKAVALVSWLVGRELALTYGYFSRQQLQSGVHACVANKIDSGTITRTKVNRCMQIILNCCFHYIIPRSDGSEENSEVFRQQFAETAKDDCDLLATLLPPWNDVTVSREAVLQASMAEDGFVKKGGALVSPQHSPRLASAETPGSNSQDVDGDDHHSKRSVLLCFNENVRSADDAFRCHNEFIRDAANAARLQLTHSEWLSFFGENTGKPSVWDHDDAERHEFSRDFFGQLDQNELAMLRTTWCAKRYDHDHELCGFAHVEVNGGWLRRNPNVNRYSVEMCFDVIDVSSPLSGGGRLSIHKCQHGECCPMAHSREEIAFHPLNYKKNACKVSGTVQGCSLGDVCPNLHHHDAMHTIRFPGNDHHNPHQRHSSVRQHNPHDHVARPGRPSTKIPHSGAPTLYVTPAPLSSYETHLQMPGLQSLFRRRSTVVAAYLESSGEQCNLTYTNFGPEGDTGRAQRSVARNMAPRR